MLRVPYPSAVYVAGELQSGRYHFFVCFVMTICRVFNAFLLQRNICQVLITNSRPCLKDELFLGGHLYRLGLELPWLGIAPCVSVPPKGGRPVGPHSVCRGWYHSKLWILAAGQQRPGRLPTTHKRRNFYLLSLAVRQGSYYLSSAVIEVCSIRECYGLVFDLTSQR